jgi:hypothetical protein
MVTNRREDCLSLANGIDLEVRAASFRRLRGATAVAIIGDETCFWATDDTSANPDTEILQAARPMLATTGGPLVIISTPYARRGETWNTFREHYGPDGDPRILVASGTSRDFNSGLSQRVVDRALERDPEGAAAEYLGQWRSDLAAFVDRAAVERCVTADCRERPPERGRRYAGFVDPSGGSADAMTLGVSHVEKERGGERIVIDLIREVRPPFSPGQVVVDFARALDTYKVRRVYGDRYAGEWVREPFSKRGIHYEPCPQPKSDLYQGLLPLLNSGAISLLDHPRSINQLSTLERRVTRGGRDSIDHPPAAHDDVANAVAGAAWAAQNVSKTTATHGSIGGFY